MEKDSKAEFRCSRNGAAINSACYWQQEQKVRNTCVRLFAIPIVKTQTLVGKFNYVTF